MLLTKIAKDFFFSDSNVRKISIMVFVNISLKFISSKFFYDVNGFIALFYTVFHNHKKKNHMVQILYSWLTSAKYFQCGLLWGWHLLNIFTEDDDVALVWSITVCKNYAFWEISLTFIFLIPPSIAPRPEMIAINYYYSPEKCTPKWSR